MGPEGEGTMKERTTDRVSTAPDPEVPPTIGPRARVGLLAKLIVFLIAALVPLAAITWAVAVGAIRTSMREEFTSKGMVIANSLATSGSISS